MAARPQTWLTALPSALIVGSVLIRSAILFRDSPALGPVLTALFVSLVLFAVEPTFHRRWPRAYHAYVAVQAGMILWLMTGPGRVEPTFLAILLVVPSMGVASRLPSGWVAAWLGAFSLLTAVPVMTAYGALEGAGFVVILSALNVFFGLYARTTSRARRAWATTTDLLQRVQESNDRLRTAAAQKEQLAAARARHHLARELHDSVTQTAFSMNLAAQTAAILFEREPERLGPQLDHLGSLARTSLAQIQALIAELRPETVPPGRLADALRRDLAERHLPECLSMSVQVDGEARLPEAEERALFSIAREAVNNIVKHAQASQAAIRLSLSDSPSMEVRDDGRGFDPTAAVPAGRLGLASIREQAEEIGWGLDLTSSPGAGTRLRIAKKWREGSPT